MEAIFAHLQTINNEWDAIRGHCPPSSAISDHLPFRNCWELDIRSRRLLEARADKGRHLEGTNDHWGPTWDYWDWFLSLPFTAIRVGACLPGPPTIVQWSLQPIDHNPLQVAFYILHQPHPRGTFESKLTRISFKGYYWASTNSFTFSI